MLAALGGESLDIEDDRVENVNAEDCSGAVSWPRDIARHAT